MPRPDGKLKENPGFPKVVDANKPPAQVACEELYDKFDFALFLKKDPKREETVSIMMAAWQAGYDACSKDQ